MASWSRIAECGEDQLPEPTTAQIQARHEAWDVHFQDIPHDLRDTDFSQRHIDRGILLKRLEASEQELDECVNALYAKKLLYDAALLDCLEVNADLSAERRVSYTFKESLDTAEQTLIIICRVVDRMVADGVQSDDGVRLRGILLKGIKGN